MSQAKPAFPVGAGLRRRIQAGFTLIELMVVVALAAVLLGIAIPSFKDLIVGQRVKAAAFAFANAAVLARSEAINRNSQVVLAAATGGWQNGWSVKNGTIALSQQDGFPRIVITTTSTQVAYLGNGRLNAAVNHLQFNDDSGGHARCVSFDLSGLPMSRLGVCG